MKYDNFKYRTFSPETAWRLNQELYSELKTWQEFLTNCLDDMWHIVFPHCNNDSDRDDRHFIVEAMINKSLKLCNKWDKNRLIFAFFHIKYVRIFGMFRFRCRSVHAKLLIAKKENSLNFCSVTKFCLRISDSVSAPQKNLYNERNHCLCLLRNTIQLYYYFKSSYLSY